MKLLSQSDTDEIYSRLENYHSLFYTFVTLSNVWLTDTIPTACIELTKKPTIKINETWWLASDWDVRLFIIQHECLHALLQHGIRFDTFRNANDNNKAQDVVINEMLVSLFNVNRNSLPDWKKYCWIDTCFDDPSKIAKNETFQYYLSRMKKDNTSQLFDIHLDGKGSGDFAIPQEVLDTLSDDELKILQKVVGTGKFAGKGSGAIDAEFERRKEKRKVNFHKILRSLKKSLMKNTYESKYTVVQPARRFLTMETDGLQLPGIHHNHNPLKDRFSVALYIDVSGSCSAWFPMFKKAANIINADPILELECFAFDTSVTLIKFDTSLKIGGGTDFGILEASCQRANKYPDVVMVITDGYGTKITPEYLKRWLWFLTDGGTKNLIPPESKVMPLKNLSLEYLP